MTTTKVARPVTESKRTLRRKRIIEVTTLISELLAHLVGTQTDWPDVSLQKAQQKARRIVELGKS